MISKNPVKPTYLKRKIFTDDSGKELRKRLGPERPSPQLRLDGSWQHVSGTKNAFYVYSAFLDLRDRPVVRVIAAIRRNFNTDRVFCRLWRDNTGYLLNAEVEIIGENHYEYHTAAFVLCLLEYFDTLKNVDAFKGEISVVSVSASEKLASNLLEVLDITPKNSGKKNLHICVRALHGAYNDVEWMVEWIELNRMLGASHFYFYNMSIGDRLDRMLRKYPNHKELFTVLPFQLPFADIWSEGQLASGQDCLYRSMSKADWLMYVDIDEVILPHDTGMDMLQLYYGHKVVPYPATFEMLIDDASTDNQLSLVFRNAFFYQGFADDPDSLVPLKTSKKTRRLELMNWYGKQSKYVVRPTKAVIYGIHNVQKFLNENCSFNMYVGSQIARLHHYKEKCIDKSPKCVENNPSVVDRNAHRWSNRLWKRVRDRLEKIK